MKQAVDSFAVYYGYNGYTEFEASSGKEVTEIAFGTSSKAKAATMTRYASAEEIQILLSFLQQLRNLALPKSGHPSLYEMNGYYGYTNGEIVTILVPIYGGQGFSGLIVCCGETIEGGCEDNRHLNSDFQHYNVGNAKVVYVVAE